MPKKDAEEGIVTRQIKQRRRNQEWYEFLMEKRNALVLRLRSSGVATSHKGYGSFDVGGVGEELDLLELEIDGGLLDVEAGQRPGAQIEAASPDEALRLRTSSPAVSPSTSLTPKHPYGAYDAPDGYAVPPVQAAEQNDVEDGGYSPGIPENRNGADTSRAFSPRAYGDGVHENTSESAQSPLLEHAEPPGGLHGADKGSPLRYIKGPGGATFAIPHTPRTPHSSSSVSQPFERAAQRNEEAAASDLAALASSPAPSYVSGGEDWAKGFDYSGAGISREDPT